MSRGYSRVVLMGNLARDPVIRHTPTKQRVANLTIAVGNEWKDKTTGEKKGHVDFISCEAWGALSDVAERYLAKGRPVLVEGRIQVRDYDDPKTGTHKWVTSVVVGEIVLLPTGNRDEGQGQGQTYTQARSQPQPSQYKQGDRGAGKSAKSQAGVSLDEDFPLNFSEFEDEDSFDEPPF